MLLQYVLSANRGVWRSRLVKVHAAEEDTARYCSSRRNHLPFVATKMFSVVHTPTQPARWYKHNSTRFDHRIRVRKGKKYKVLLRVSGIKVMRIVCVCDCVRVYVL